MAMREQWEVYKGVRKPQPPRGKAIRPSKGGGYRRREKHQKPWI